MGGRGLRRERTWGPVWRGGADELTGLEWKRVFGDVVCAYAAYSEHGKHRIRNDNITDYYGSNHGSKFLIIIRAAGATSCSSSAPACAAGTYYGSTGAGSNISTMSFLSNILFNLIIVKWHGFQTA